MRKFSWFSRMLACCCAFTGLVARETTHPVEGLHAFTPRVHALVEATVVTAPGEVAEQATIIIRDGLIEASGTDVAVPPDARVWDLSGKTVYAGFIDAYSQLGMPDGLQPFIRQTPAEEGAPSRKNPPAPKASGASYWNPLVTPERRASDFINIKKKQLETMHSLGMTAVASFPGRGIVRGQGVLIHLDGRSLQEAVIATDIAQHISFETASRGAGYPASLMGSIALVRQALYDAQWYDTCWGLYTDSHDQVERPEYNAALESLASVPKLGQLALFHARDELDYQRIQRISEEFDLKWALLGNGYEYRRAAILEQTGASIILPLAFPDVPPVERVDRTLEIPLEHLEHWEFAPSNPAFLEKSGVPFCLTAHHLSEPGGEFWKNLRLAVKRGLSEETALSSLTTRPAALYAMQDRLGTIGKGKIGNLVVATGNLFSDDKAKVAMVWVDGNPMELEPWTAGDIAGRWRFTWQGIDGFSEGTFATKGDKVTLEANGSKISGTIQGDEILLYVDSAIFGVTGDATTIARLQATRKGNIMTGTGSLTGTGTFRWTAEFQEEVPADDRQTGDSVEQAPDLVFDKYPAGAFGVTGRHHHKEILVRNATVWTSGPDGVLENTDLLVRKGKIVAVGKELKNSQDAHVIDASGKHVTAGIIDCHSHLAISNGVNESGSAVSSEVRISDVVNPVDINIYRQLAGGVSTSNSLHGSANPIGGLGQVLRLRWGEDAEGLKFTQAKPGIKFALGENVKQSNWGPENNTRYPQTRMGVPEIIESNFRAARDYERHWAEYESGNSPLPPRKDLRMQAILETARRERAVHIHAYRQDEILEFSRLADKLNLDVAVFHHVLEGYKVAEALTDIDAGGSSFSDWWAYKVEVYDAIPQNASLMHEQGALVSINSDNAELATRLNTEAAKTVKYGGVSEEEALKFITINAAMQLDIQDHVGSLEPGKDADFVIWSGDPLSTLTHAEQTWIEGVKYFDREDDKQLAERDEQERERLIQKALPVRLKALKLDADKKRTGSGSPDGPDTGQSAGAWLYNDENINYSDFQLDEGFDHE